jgi:ADP-dependent NAD(P)H-hydrate dehydratase / NAD(P)H-hydrate epimerase
MLHAHTVEQVRAAEAELMATLPDGALMQRAAAGLAYAVIDLLGSAYGRRAVLLVGGGDNGGDALYAGAMLARRGCGVEAVLLSERAHEEGLAALRAAGGRVVDQPTKRPDVVLDGIVGIGGRAGLRPEAANLLRLLHGVPVVAVDVPSGVDVDTGETDAGEGGGDHVVADLTVTFGTHKIAHLVDPAAAACGAVHLVDIGLDAVLGQGHATVEALQPVDVDGLLPRPAADAHKYTRGVVGIRAGSAEYPGAGLLSVAGAASGLAGMVRYVGDDAVAAMVREAHPEVVGLGRVQAWVVGSGSGDGAKGTLQEALDDRVPLVVDADALQHLPRRLHGVPAVLTPHAGELAAMLGVDRNLVEGQPLRHVREAAARSAAVVLLKGRRTLVARPDGAVRANTTGTAWLATAGAGDVLGGLVGALLAAGLAPYDAASVAAWLHGAAATIAAADGPLVAGDVANAIPEAVRAVLSPS